MNNMEHGQILRLEDYTDLLMRLTNRRPRYCLGTIEASAGKGITAISIPRAKTAYQ